MSRGKLPLSLYVVAAFFVIAGVLAVIDIFVALAHGHANINFGVLGLFIGPGLLRLRRGWRTCALIFIWIALICVPVLAIWIVVADEQPDFNLNGQRVGLTSKAIGLLFAGAAFAVALWQYHVLTRADVRQLFGNLHDGEYDTHTDTDDELVWGDADESNT